MFNLTRTTIDSDQLIPRRTIDTTADQSMGRIDQSINITRRTTDTVEQI